MQEVRTIITQLAYIGINIRRGGTRGRRQNADARFDAGQHRDLEQYLVLLLFLKTVQPVHDTTASSVGTPWEHRFISMMPTENQVEESRLSMILDQRNTLLETASESHLTQTRRLGEVTIVPHSDFIDDQDHAIAKRCEIVSDKDDLELTTLCTTVQSSRWKFLDAQLSTKDLTEAQQQLVRCNLLRRNRFLHAQRHADKLTTAAALPKRIDQILIDGGSEIQEPSTANETHPLYTARHAAATRDTETPTVSALTISVIDSPVNEISTKRRLQSTPTVVSRTSRRKAALLPNPPQADSGKDIFRCPCCCEDLDTALATQATGDWRSASRSVLTS